MDLLKRLNELREEGNFEDSLQLSDQALIEFANDPSKFTEAILARVLVLRHLFEETQNKSFAKLAKFEAKAAIKILEMNNISEGMVFARYSYAKCLESLGKYDKAIDEIREILNSDLDKTVQAEIKTRLFALEYMVNGESMVDFESSVSELVANPHPDTYTQAVWLSGAYLHMAHACSKRGEKEKAKELLESARDVIGEDEKYKLRSSQIEKLKQQL